MPREAYDNYLMILECRERPCGPGVYATAIGEDFGTLDAWPWELSENASIDPFAGHLVLGWNKDNLSIETSAALLWHVGELNVGEVQDTSCTTASIVAEPDFLTMSFIFGRQFHFIAILSEFNDNAGHHTLSIVTPGTGQLLVSGIQITDGQKWGLRIRNTGHPRFLEAEFRVNDSVIFTIPAEEAQFEKSNYGCNMISAFALDGLFLFDDEWRVSSYTMSQPRFPGQ